MRLAKKYAVVSFSKATLENYNHSVVFESDDIDECENFEREENAVSGSTVVEQREDGIYGYYTGEPYIL